MAQDSITVKQSVHGHLDIACGGIDLDLLDDLLEIAEEGVSEDGRFTSREYQNSLHETLTAFRAAIHRFRTA